MSYRNAEFDMTHSFSSYNRSCEFYSTLFADNTLISDTFIFSAITFVVLFRSEDFFIEETVLFTSLGFSYGWLYSAILLTRPQRLVVVTSAQAVGNLHSTVDAARFFHTTFEVEAHVLEDALAGFPNSPARGVLTETVEFAIARAF